MFKFDLLIEDLDKDVTGPQQCKGQLKNVLHFYKLMNDDSVNN